MQRAGGKAGGVRIADLRAQLRAEVEKQKPEHHSIGKPPKPRKGAPVDVQEERAAKAEKFAAIQHSTSLLTKDPKHSRARAYREPRRGGGFMLQLFVVVAIAGGVAYALDPTTANSVIRSIDWQALKDMTGIKG